MSSPPRLLAFLLSAACLVLAGGAVVIALKPGAGQANSSPVYLSASAAVEQTSAPVEIAPAPLQMAPAQEAAPEPAPLPDRTTCEEIRGTEYRSDAERAFFLASCIVVAPAAPRANEGKIVSSTQTTGLLVTAIGDSVMLGAANQLAQTIEGIEVDAMVGRQVESAIALLQADLASDRTAPVVLLHLGNNGAFTAGEFDTIMALLGPERVVVFVNVKEPRPWQDANNAVIAEGVARYANARLVDWYSATIDHPELFWSDSIHLRPEGAVLYAVLAAGAIQP